MIRKAVVPAKAGPIPRDACFEKEPSSRQPAQQQRPVVMDPGLRSQELACRDNDRLTASAFPAPLLFAPLADEADERRARPGPFRTALPPARATLRRSSRTWTASGRSTLRDKLAMA